MVTKYIVKDNNIYLYENDQVVATLENDENNLKLIKLLNDQVFIKDDISNAEIVSKYYHDSTKRYALYTLFVGVVVGIFALINMAMVTSISLLILAFNVIAFIISNDKLKKSDKRITYLKNIQKKIEDRIDELEKNLSNKKVDNQTLTYTNEQIVKDHKKWLEDYNEVYDYQSDVNLINNSKVYVKK